MKWFRLAADQGDAIAQCNLGAMYAKGQGVPQDYVLAQCGSTFLLRRATKDAVKNRDIAAGQMTPDQLAEAQRLAREWKPSPN